MTQEEKELLLKDLSARLAYGVKVHIEGDYFYDEIEPYDTKLKSEVLGHLIASIYSVKPYLRPMSSMTEEENNEWRDSWLGDLFEAASVVYPKSEEFLAPSHSKSIDWLNKHHFDYNGLIPKGLALEAPEGMYKYKNIEYTNL